MAYKSATKKLIDFPDEFLEKVKKTYPNDRTMYHLIMHGHGFMGNKLKDDAKLKLSANEILDYIERGDEGVKELVGMMKELQFAQELYDEYNMYYDKHIEKLRKKNDR